jgi:hypothetical protein
MLLSRYGRLVFAKLKTSLLSSYVRKIIIGVKFELNVRKRGQMKVSLISSSLWYINGIYL